ncbi:MAG: hypothetical protein DSM106950_27570 [Stigonema ocellatum SAG 48.90 = DSM 106950]|nr:hypothetical protein [Stigonema ocellatum SAG 48.90 = DSM 106950]
MDADKLIEAFTEVVQEQDYVFSSSAMEDIPSLRNTLAELDNKSLESVAEAIRQWFLNHESVRDAVLGQEREISRVKKASPASQENTLENRYRVLDEGLKKLEEKKQK